MRASCGGGSVVSFSRLLRTLRSSCLTSDLPITAGKFSPVTLASPLCGLNSTRPTQAARSNSTIRVWGWLGERMYGLPNLMTIPTHDSRCGLTPNRRPPLPIADPDAFPRKMRWRGLGNPISMLCKRPDGQPIIWPMGMRNGRKYFIRYDIVPRACAVFLRKAIYEQVDVADESYRLNGDWKLWSSIALTDSDAMPWVHAGNRSQSGDFIEKSYCPCRPIQ
jgi:hypothetical protein